MIYIVTDTEAGWDCIVGVFDDYDLAHTACKPHPDSVKFYEENGYLNPQGLIETYHIHEKKLNDSH